MESQDFRKESNLKLNGLKIMGLIEFNAFRRNKNVIYSQLMQPAMYFLFLVMGIGKTIGSIKYGKANIPYEMYALTGIMGILITSQMTQTIYRTTIDKRWGLLSLKFLSGIRPIIYILGMTTFPLIGFLIQTFILYILALITGFYFSFASFTLGVLVAIIALLFWTSLGVAITVFINDYQKRDSIISLLIMPLGFTAPTFFILSDVPLFIQLVAYLNPLTYQITAVRSIIFLETDIFFIVITIMLTLSALLFATVILQRAELVINEK